MPAGSDRQLSFHCPDDSLVRITAAEGAGLSTLKHLLLRQVTPERGLVRVGGMDVARLDPTVLAYSVIMLDHPRDTDVRRSGSGCLLNRALNHRRLRYICKHCLPTIG